MPEIQFESVTEKPKRTIKKHRLWLWLPRLVAILIIICFFFPLFWSSQGGGVFINSGIQYIVESIRDTEWDEVQNPLFFRSVILYFLFPLVGALICLIISLKKNKKWNAVIYALYSIMSSSMLIAILIIYMDLGFRTLTEIVAIGVLLGTIPVVVILSLIYLYLMRTRNIQMLRFYVICIVSFFGLLFGYHLVANFIIQPAFDVIGFATLSFLVFAYQAFMDSLPSRKQKRDFQLGH